MVDTGGQTQPGTDSLLVEFWRWFVGGVGVIATLFLTRLTNRYSLVVEKVTRLEVQINGMKEQLDRLERRLDDVFRGHRGD